ncbi:unnamed protein product [Owenia fusiformis]|uniref:Uncharacterized protein n=1 Tax=Owenia fusiformis TaxID=6347 RepID=A0A8J1UPB2_OWEFU|nr:unnamed protein product [Owenia fusiformis]
MYMCTCGHTNTKIMELHNFSNTSIAQTFVITILIVAVFLCTKTTYDSLRKRWAQVTIVVVGAGPVGLISVLIAAATGKCTRIIVYESKSRHELLSRRYQIGIDSRSVLFLQQLGVDFDNIEGCWQMKKFYTRTNVFQQYILDNLYKYESLIQVKLSTKFTRECLADIGTRVVVVAADGPGGQTASCLGQSEEYIHQSCRAYGAVAMLERKDEATIPAPEIRVHNLTFDLSAYGAELNEVTYPQTFHFKIFGSLRNRYLSLVVPKCDSKVVKALKSGLEQSLLRNIFQACFNTYKSENESRLSDKACLKLLKFSPRLADIKLSHRLETVMYLEEPNVFVTVEGEAARTLNFHSGLDVNLGIQGLESLGQFINMAASADTETSILDALIMKSQHSRQVAQQFIKTGIHNTMFS